MLEILLDPEDAHLWSLPWYIGSTGYIRRGFWRDGRMQCELLHRRIAEAQPGQEVDHINGNPLDNRRCNLRVCSHMENVKNRGPSRNNTSGFKGVYYDARRGTFRADIRADRKKYSLGSFATAVEAAEAYNAAALKYHRDFARLNRTWPDPLT